MRGGGRYARFGQRSCELLFDMLSGTDTATGRKGMQGRVHQKNKSCEIELSRLPICFTGRYITAVKIISLLKVI